MMTTPAPRSRPRRAASRIALAAAAGALVLGLAACGDDSDTSAADATTTTASAGGGETTTTASSGGAASTVEARDFAFNDLTVAPGAEFTFENYDTTTHTLTADDGAFDSGQVAGGEEVSLTAPTAPGSYTFHCEIHASMTGTLTVEG